MFDSGAVLHTFSRLVEPFLGRVGAAFSTLFDLRTRGSINLGLSNWAPSTGTWSFAVFLTITFLVIFCCRSAHALDATNVLVVYNSASADGLAIANHYQQVHPGSQTLGIDLSSLPNNGLNEEISANDYLAPGGLRDQILGSLTTDTDVIVTTKGMPLRIRVDQSNPFSYTDPGGVFRSVLDWETYSSLESELARIDTIETWQQMGDQTWFFTTGNPPSNNPALNPYYLEGTGFDHDTYGIRLTSRLDGFTSQDVIDSIGRAQNVQLVIEDPNSPYHFILDDRPAGADRMELLELNVLTPRGVPTTYDSGPGFIQQPTVTNPSQTEIIGYVGHGTNGGAPTDYLVNPVTGIQFQPSDGAVFHSYESFNAITFDPNVPVTQGLVAQWIASGGTAGLGHVQEPTAGANTVTNEDILFRELLPDLNAAPGDTGLTWVEAAWGATRQLSFVNTVIGDPLMVWQIQQPGLQGDTNGDGVVEFNDFYTLQGNWMTPGNLEDGDFTGDGFIDQQDFLILQDNWLMTDSAATSFEQVTHGISIETMPELDPNSGWPMLSTSLNDPANLNGDLNVDGSDLDVFESAYGVDGSGDIDGDGDTDSSDFLIWQRSLFEYTLTADPDFSGHIDQKDLIIWQNSYLNDNLGGDANGDGKTGGLDLLIAQRELSVTTILENPEPTSLATAFLAVLASCCLQRRAAHLLS